MSFFLATSLMVLEGCGTHSVSKEKYIPDDVTISVLVDLGIPEENKGKIFVALEELFDSISDGRIYLSFFGENVGPSEPITKETFDSESLKSVIREKFKTEVSQDTCFYSALYAKLSEFSTVDYKLAGEKNLLVVFTDTTDMYPQTVIGYDSVVMVFKKDHVVVNSYVCTMGGSVNKNKERLLSSVLGNYTFKDNFDSLTTEFKKKVSNKFEERIEGGDSQDNKATESKSSKGPSLTLGDYLTALLLTLLTILFYVLVIKVLIPEIKSCVFEMKYCQKYNGDVNIQCWYCKKDIKPGERIVNRCEHKVHKGCWKEHYCCPEYGQNCKVGVQSHVDWKCLPTMNTLREFYLTIAGACAGLVGWVIYSVTTVSSFLILGLLFAFSISFVFRCINGIRKKDWRSLLSITGWSLLSGIIGMAAFALGDIVFCLLSPSDSSSLWSYALAYLLFSVCTSFSLTIRSCMSIKHALVGGFVSAMIGFLVLLLIGIPNPGQEGTNMLPLLLNFVIYGGGLGISIVIARKLVRN